MAREADGSSTRDEDAAHKTSGAGPTYKSGNLLCLDILEALRLAVLRVTRRTGRGTDDGDYDRQANYREPELVLILAAYEGESTPICTSTTYMCEVASRMASFKETLAGCLGLRV